MEIAIINKYQDKVNRGAETFVSELSKRLSKNHNVDILTSINWFKRYDIVIPTNGRLQAFLVRLLTWLTNSKMIVSGQSGVGLDDRLNLYAFPDTFVAISSYALKKSKDRNPFVKSVYIPNGVDLNMFLPQGVTLRYKKRKTVLSVGAFTEQKRHELVIRAVAKLKDVKLVIAGGGGDKKEEIQALGTRLLGNKFELQQVDHSKMPVIYNMADVFTLASKTYESFGIVLVEAMASGLPVVATDDQIRREIVGDAGLFVDPSSVEEYAAALEKALNTNWGDKPRKQAEKFDWDKIALEYEKLFTKLIARGSARGLRDVI